MDYKLKDDRYSNRKHVYQEDCVIGICYWTSDDKEWYFTPRYHDNFFSADQLFEIANMLKQLNETSPDPFKKEK